MSNTLTTDPITVPAKLPKVPTTRLPSGVELAPDGIATAAATFARLEAEHRAAVAELRDLEAKVPDVVAADRRKLAEAMANGAKDPGTREQDKLADTITAAHRRVVGLADATNDAHNALRAALAAEGDLWRAQLADAAKGHRQAVLGALDAVAVEVAALQASERLAAWLDRVASTHAGRSLPTPMTPTPTVSIGGTPTSLADVLAAVATWAAE